MNKEPMVRVRNLTKTYGKGCERCGDPRDPESNQCPTCLTVTACRDVTFDLYPDEVMGIVGESGSGKSTVVRLLHFDMEPTGGEFYLNLNGSGIGSSGEGGPLVGPEENLFALSSFRRRQVRNALMGMVYQNASLGLRMRVSAGGNIAERLLMAGWRHVGNMRERASELLLKTEVPIERMDERPGSFSGGMQQRVQIAKALSVRPALLLLDEVTTGLDVSVQARVLDLIRSLQRELHVATIVVSHDLGVIRLLTSRTVVMRHGRIVEEGLSDQILEDPQHPYTQLLVHSTL